MLTLTRKVGQKILIGDDIEIVVRDVRGRQVRLGIVAPAGTPVFREELRAQIAKKHAEAAELGTEDDAVHRDEEGTAAPDDASDDASDDAPSPKRENDR